LDLVFFTGKTPQSVIIFDWLEEFDDLLDRRPLERAGIASNLFA